jgi:DNA repair exonuclease SbcCD ATPase subunit
VTASPTHRSIDVLSTEVTALKQSIAGINLRLDSISADLQNKSKPQWALLISGAMFLMSFMTVIGGLAFWPIRSDVARLEDQYRELRLSMVSKEDAKDRREIAQDRMRKNEAEVERIQATIVPRGEHEEKWRTSDFRFQDLGRRVDELKKDYSELSSPKDTIKNMQSQIEELQRRVK